MHQIILHNMSFIPYQPFDFELFLKVTVAIWKWTLWNSNVGTNPLEASNQDVYAILLFASL